MSPFEEIFGENSSIANNTDELLAICRDDLIKELIKFAPEDSLISSPACVIYAMYKSIENNKKENYDIQ